MGSKVSQPATKSDAEERPKQFRWIHLPSSLKKLKRHIWRRSRKAEAEDAKRVTDEAVAGHPSPWQPENAHGADIRSLAVVDSGAPLPISRPATPDRGIPPSPSLANRAAIPCPYKLGKTLGTGTYAIVKEALHVESDVRYACKIISKRRVKRSVHMIRNEIAALKRVSNGHPNVVSLHDYFETKHQVYLCFDLCTGGELFERILSKGSYTEADAASLVRIILKAVKHIHDSGVIHRDLKPENLLFRDGREDADIMIADFGLSKVTDDQLTVLMDACGTPGYMAPEILTKKGHGKAVDVWAIGVITYFLLAGKTPWDPDPATISNDKTLAFDRHTREKEATIKGEYSFEPDHWARVSATARDFIKSCLIVNPKQRPTAGDALKHGWFADEEAHCAPPDSNSTSVAPTNLLPQIRTNSTAVKSFRTAVLGVMAAKRMSAISEKSATHSEQAENPEDPSVIYHHNFDYPDKPTSMLSEENSVDTAVIAGEGQSIGTAMASTHLPETVIPYTASRG